MTSRIEVGFMVAVGSSLGAARDNQSTAGWTSKDKAAVQHGTARMCANLDHIVGRRCGGVGEVYVESW